jgi:D-alanyl-D-alanine carboxypeptidase/D-alanyl-D-alanine-endopeptidase (penicillin-binding protein 4)
VDPTPSTPNVVRARSLAASLLATGLVTALLAPQPAPAQNTSQLRSDLTQALETYRWQDAQWGVLVVSLDQGDTLFAVEPGAALAPASNLKLLTTAAALRRLGPDFRFQTYLLTSGTVSHGVLRGDLVLYGTGDPGISDRFFSEKDEVFQLLVDQLEQLGITSITGRLIADASHLPGPLRPTGWDPADLNDHFAGAVSALSYNENVVSFRVVAGSRSGVPPEVHTVPDNAGLDVVNNALTVAGRARPRLAILREDPLEPIRIEGRVTRGTRDVWRQMTVASPPHFAASALRAVLTERGIRLQGGIEVVKTPASSIVGRVTAPTAEGRSRTRILAKHVSAPLSEYLAVVNKRSNNLFAELIFRTVGRSVEGHGSPRASAKAVLDAVAEIGVPTADLVLLDGSGLSAGSRVTAGSFVALIAGMAETEQWPAYWASLPTAGQPRELRRMYSTAAAGNLQAKTGTIEGVSALTGMVRSRDQERLAFSILLNGTPSTTQAKRVENIIGARLADFARAPGQAPSVTVAEADPDLTNEGDDGRYRVRRGENLSTIAQRHGLTLDAMLRANPRVEPNRIFAGQWLAIPQAGGGG